MAPTVRPLSRLVIQGSISKNGRCAICCLRAACGVIISLLDYVGCVSSVMTTDVPWTAKSQ
jgi:hypothetical protein